MSKKTIALIIALFAITVLLIVLAIFPVTQRTNVSITPTPIIKNVAETVLAFAPPVASGSATYTMDVNILTGRNRANAVQIELSYDPKVLLSVDIKPGDFFTTPAVLLKNVDVEQGRISFALAVGPGQNGKQGTGTIAILSFRSATESATTIRFLPKTQVAAEGIQTSVLKSSIDSTIFGGTSSATLSQ